MILYIYTKDKKQLSYITKHEGNFSFHFFDLYKQRDINKLDIEIHTKK